MAEVAAQIMQRLRASASGFTTTLDVPRANGYLIAGFHAIDAISNGRESESRERKIPLYCPKALLRVFLPLNDPRTHRIVRHGATDKRPLGMYALTGP